MRGTGHLPLSGFFVMRIPVHGSQSGSLDLNIESVFASNIDSFQIMNLYCSHHLLTSGPDQTPLFLISSSSSLPTCCCSAKRTSRNRDWMLWVTYRHPPGVEYETKLGNIVGLRICPSRFEDCRTDHPPRSRRVEFVEPVNWISNVENALSLLHK